MVCKIARFAYKDTAYIFPSVKSYLHDGLGVTSLMEAPNTNVAKGVRLSIARLPHQRSVRALTFIPGSASYSVLLNFSKQ